MSDRQSRTSASASTSAAGAGRRLGRGLEALIEASRAEESGELLHLPPEAIEVTARNPRLEFEGAGTDELVRSIERHGILQPLVVRRSPAAPDRYELVCGERRLRAAREIGLATVPCVRVDVPDERVLETMLIENLHREDLDPIETAKAYRALIEQHGFTQDEVATRVAKSRPAIANALRLLELPENLQDMIAAGAISAGHARAIAALKTPAEQDALARRAEREGLSVREVEAIVQGKKIEAGGAAPQPRKRRRAKGARPGYLDVLEDRMRKAIGTRVAIEQSAPGRGRIVIDFYSDDEFERLLEFFS